MLVQRIAQARRHAEPDVQRTGHILQILRPQALTLRIGVQRERDLRPGLRAGRCASAGPVVRAAPAASAIRMAAGGLGDALHGRTVLMAQGPGTAPGLTLILGTPR